MSASPLPARRTRLPLLWPSWLTHSSLGIRCRHPAGKGTVPAVVRGLVERGLPELVVTGIAGDHRVSHAAAVPGSLPGRHADAWLPAHLRLARPQIMTEWAVFRLVLEQRSGHLDDHARTSRSESMMMCSGCLARWLNRAANLLVFSHVID